MTEKEKQRQNAKTDSPDDSHIDKCLAMVIHHEEIEQMAAIIKRIQRDRSAGQTAIGDQSNE